MSMKNPLTLAGIEPATFRFVAQHLDHCATAVPPTRKGILHYKPGQSSRRNRQHVHRLVFHVARTSHTTQNAIPTFSLCNHFPAAKNRNGPISYFSSRDTFYTRRVLQFHSRKPGGGGSCQRGVM